MVGKGKGKGMGGLVVMLLLVVLGMARGGMIRHDGEKILRVRSEKESVHQWLFDSFDVLEARRDSFEVRATPSQFHLLRDLGVEVDVLVNNVQEQIDEEMRLINEASLNDTWFSNYHTYDELKAHYQELARDNGATFIPSIGKSHEGRDLFALTFGTPGKPGFYIQSLQHAREWISGAATNYLVHHILTQQRSILNDYYFVVVPVVNPDGYSYSWTRDRLWRKNRRNNGGSYGVDLNRNWNSHWGQGGSSSLPSSDTYMGPSVASEPEVQAIVKFFLSQPNLIAGFDMHCYSQLVLRPYGWKRGDAEHESQLFPAAQGIADDIFRVHGKRFQNIHSIELYLTTGTTSDWFYDDEVKAEFGKRMYAYTLELRPSSALPGFQLPPSEIIPSGEELIPAFLNFFKYASSNPISS